MLASVSSSVIGIKFLDGLWLSNNCEPVVFLENRIPVWNKSHLVPPHDCYQAAWRELQFPQALSKEV